MGIEIAIIIASVSAFISLIAGGVSVATIQNSQQQSSTKNQEESGAYMKLTFTKEEFDPEHGGMLTFNKETSYSPVNSDTYKYYNSSGIVSRLVQEQVIQLTGKGEEEFLHSVNLTRTGLPNKTSEILGNGASAAYASIISPVQDDILRIEEIPSTDLPLLGEGVVSNSEITEID